jgi:hypothetical protein
MRDRLNGGRRGGVRGADRRGEEEFTASQTGGRGGRVTRRHTLNTHAAIGNRFLLLVCLVFQTGFRPTLGLPPRTDISY